MAVCSRYRLVICLLSITCFCHVTMLICLLFGKDSISAVENQWRDILKHNQKKNQSRLQQSSITTARTLPISKEEHRLATTNNQNDYVHLFANVSVSALFENSQISITYPPFNYTQPMFIDEKDKLIFLSNKENLKELAPVTLKHIQGQIVVLERSWVSLHQHCGWDTDIGVFSQQGALPAKETIHELLVPLLIPGGATYQHFIDGVLPKILQIYPIIRKLRKYTLLLYRSKDPIIEQILQELGIKPASLRYYQGGIFKTDRQINTCITPPLHPVLWNKARDLLINTQGTPTTRRVILLTRQGWASRRIVNLPQVKEALESIYGSYLVVVRGNLDLESTKEVFLSAYVIIGVHGGAMYNMLFSPNNSTVIEFVPTIDDKGRTSKSIAANIFWKMSVTMGHNYWRIYTRTVNARHDVSVDIEKLKEVLRRC